MCVCVRVCVCVCVCVCVRESINKCSGIHLKYYAVMLPFIYSPGRDYFFFPAGV